MLDQRALFCIEEATKRTSLSSLAIKGGCLGGWGTAFIARGARIEGAGLETLSLVDCRLRAEGAASVASLLSRGCKLVDVNLAGNGIGDDGMHALAKELHKNEYLERLRLQRNRITNKRMKELSESVGKHPALRTLDLSHNSIGYAGAIHLAGGVKESTALQHLHLAHNACRADALYRLANVCTGHESMATLDCRGISLRNADRRRLEAHTRFTRLVILIDQPTVVADPAATPVLEGGKGDAADAHAGAEAAPTGEPSNLQEVDTSTPTVGADEEVVPVLPASLLQRSDMLPSVADAKDVAPQKPLPTFWPRREWSVPEGDVSTKDWVTGFSQLALY
jgi:hypothetical protein